MPFARKQHPEPAPHGPDSPPSRNFAFVLGGYRRPAVVKTVELAELLVPEQFVAHRTPRVHILDVL